jgi:hypothetical protein
MMEFGYFSVSLVGMKIIYISILPSPKKGVAVIRSLVVYSIYISEVLVDPGVMVVLK